MPLGAPEYLCDTHYDPDVADVAVCVLPKQKRGLGYEQHARHADWNCSNVQPATAEQGLRSLALGMTWSRIKRQNQRSAIHLRPHRQKNLQPCSHLLPTSAKLLPELEAIGFANGGNVRSMKVD